MATRYFGTANERPTGSGDFVGASSGGTLAGSQKLQVVFDDTYYAATNEGKEKLIASLDLLLDRLKSAKVWPIGSTS